MRPSLAPPPPPASPHPRRRGLRLGLRLGLLAAPLGLLCACGAGTKPPPKATGGWQVLAPAAWDVDPASVQVPDIGGRG